MADTGMAPWRGREKEQDIEGSVSGHSVRELLPEEEYIIADVANPTEVLCRIHELVKSFLIEIAKPEPSISVLNMVHRSAKNAVLQSGRGSSGHVEERVLLLSNLQKRSLLGSKGQGINAFVRVWKVLEMVSQLLESGKQSTQRDLFYRLVSEAPSYFENQTDANSAIQDCVALLRCSRQSLGIIAASRGAVIGRLWIKEKPDGNWIDCTKVSSEGKVIAGNIESLNNWKLHTDAHYIFVLEKDAIFQRLAEDRLFMTLPSILITAKGFPDLATRAFLKRLSTDFPHLPILALVDWNPAGFAIICTYKYGSTSMGLESPRYACDVKWLGLRAADVEHLPDDAFQSLSEREHRMLINMLDSPNVRKRESYASELQKMKDGNRRAEIEALFTKVGMASHSDVQSVLTEEETRDGGGTSSDMEDGTNSSAKPCRKEGEDSEAAGTTWIEAVRGEEDTSRTYDVSARGYNDDDDDDDEHGTLSSNPSFCLSESGKGSELPPPPRTGTQDSAGESVDSSHCVLIDQGWLDLGLDDALLLRAPVNISRLKEIADSSESPFWPQTPPATDPQTEGLLGRDPCQQLEVEHQRGKVKLAEDEEEEEEGGEELIGTESRKRAVDAREAVRHLLQLRPSPSSYDDGNDGDDDKDSDGDGVRITDRIGQSGMDTSNRSQDSADVTRRATQLNLPSDTFSLQDVRTDRLSIPDMPVDHVRLTDNREKAEQLVKQGRGTKHSIPRLNLDGLLMSIGRRAQQGTTTREQVTLRGGASRVRVRVRGALRASGRMDCRTGRLKGRPQSSSGGDHNTSAARREVAPPARVPRAREARMPNVEGRAVSLSLIGDYNPKARDMEEQKGMYKDGDNPRSVVEEVLEHMATAAEKYAERGRRGSQPPVRDDDCEGVLPIRCGGDVDEIFPSKKKVTEGDFLSPTQVVHVRTSEGPKYDQDLVRVKASLGSAQELVHTVSTPGQLPVGSMCQHENKDEDKYKNEDVYDSTNVVRLTVDEAISDLAQEIGKSNRESQVSLHDRRSSILPVRGGGRRGTLSKKRRMERDPSSPRGRPWMSGSSGIRTPARSLSGSVDDLVKKYPAQVQRPLRQLTDMRGGYAKSLDRPVKAYHDGNEAEMPSKWYDLEDSSMGQDFLISAAASGAKIPAMEFTSPLMRDHTGISISSTIIGKDAKVSDQVSGIQENRKYQMRDADFIVSQRQPRSDLQLSDSRALESIPQATITEYTQTLKDSKSSDHTVSASLAARDIGNQQGSLDADVDENRRLGKGPFLNVKEAQRPVREGVLRPVADVTGNRIFYDSGEMAREGNDQATGMTAALWHQRRMNLAVVELDFQRKELEKKLLEEQAVKRESLTAGEMNKLKNDLKDEMESFKRVIFDDVRKAIHNKHSLHATRESSTGPLVQDETKKIAARAWEWKKNMALVELQQRSKELELKLKEVQAGQGTPEKGSMDKSKEVLQLKKELIEEIRKAIAKATDSGSRWASIGSGHSHAAHAVSVSPATASKWQWQRSKAVLELEQRNTELSKHLDQAGKAAARGNGERTGQGQREDTTGSSKGTRTGRVFG
ncbi:hypothetical protein CBR_g19885 [Chara braunii]|uniref:DNA topoisomerase (ATP-hydrolyzing) n=1 Tax=Chara braunii TaxID=69332 RepID=A0A388KYY4_CHABU|nr:hypothetical protein CBR_g19885 [Chara braunii]|eukprot:GBG75251.1 hypothetical protein CBR_g19885 [Chara braunii]